MATAAGLAKAKAFEHQTNKPKSSNQPQPTKQPAKPSRKVYLSRLRSAALKEHDSVSRNKWWARE
ncbi:hypothetical protein, partial [Rhizobium sp. CFBP 8762]|uniref:hypothetical protein n=1 Tax=Rhizobium sp. CFBP 8762 TaxID=2775279 RepID=UPI001A7E8573